MLKRVHCDFDGCGKEGGEGGSPRSNTANPIYVIKWLIVRQKPGYKTPMAIATAFALFFSDGHVFFSFVHFELSDFEELLSSFSDSSIQFSRYGLVLSISCSVCAL